METSMNDRTAVFVHTFPVGKHTVNMTLTRRRFHAGRMTCRWSPTSRPDLQRRKSTSIAVAERPWRRLSSLTTELSPAATACHGGADSALLWPLCDELITIVLLCGP